MLVDRTTTNKFCIGNQIRNPFIQSEIQVISLRTRIFFLYLKTIWRYFNEIWNIFIFLCVKCNDTPRSNRTSHPPPPSSVELDKCNWCWIISYWSRYYTLLALFVMWLYFTQSELRLLKSSLKLWLIRLEWNTLYFLMNKWITSLVSCLFYNPWKFVQELLNHHAYMFYFLYLLYVYI